MLHWMCIFNFDVFIYSKTDQICNVRLSWGITSDLIICGLFLIQAKTIWKRSTLWRQFLCSNISFRDDSGLVSSTCHEKLRSKLSTLTHTISTFPQADVSHHNKGHQPGRQRSLPELPESKHVTAGRP